MLVGIKKKLHTLVNILKRKRWLRPDDLRIEDFRAGQLNLNRAKEQGLINAPEDAIGFFIGGLHDHASERLQLRETEDVTVEGVGKWI